MSEEAREVHGLYIPSKGEKVVFMNLNKQHKAIGDGVHTCYQLIKHHQCVCCKKKTEAKSSSTTKKKTASKKSTTKKK
jgi:hypothetical protein